MFDKDDQLTVCPPCKPSGMRLELLDKCMGSWMTLEVATSIWDYRLHSHAPAHGEKAAKKIDLQPASARVTYVAVLLDAARRTNELSWGL